jgi:hypothetical protein
MATTLPDGSYHTLKGIALVAKLLAAKGKLEFTKATVGSGIIPDGITPEEMTDLSEYVMDGKIAAIENPQNGEALVSVQVMSSGAGFYATELMLWAKDPETGEEIAYTYLSIAQRPEWIRPGTDPVQKLATFNLIAIVSSVPLVSATIHPDAFARAKDLAELQAFKLNGEMVYNLINCGYFVEAPQPITTPTTAAVYAGETLNFNPYSFAPPNPPKDADALVFFDGFAAFGNETLILNS